jgi:TFIIF-interacting CTD phosphatase-like protein
MTLQKIEPKKLLILDLDETLIYATEQPLERKADFVAGPYFVYKRPFVDEFMAYCFENFDVAVWTTSTASYSAAIVENLVKPPHTLQFVWARDRCTWAYDEDTREQFLAKKLDKLKKRGFRLESIVVIDDTPAAWRNSYGNLVRVSRFEGEESDDELKSLPTYLDFLKGQDNVRTIEKRNWRAKIG